MVNFRADGEGPVLRGQEGVLALQGAFMFLREVREGCLPIGGDHRAEVDDPRDSIGAALGELAAPEAAHAVGDEDGWLGRLVAGLRDPIDVVVQCHLAGPRGVGAAPRGVEGLHVVAERSQRLEHRSQHQAPWTPP